ncbi:Uncharacterised protein [uncultured archaeon]|nr:Uncharacterised protein [uncultured archaeon]
MLLTLMTTGFAMLVAEYFGKKAAMLFTDWIFVPIPGALVVLSILSVKRHGLKGSHGKAWISFAVFSVMWFIAEQTWTVLELFYNQKPFPSIADFFYFAGYPAYFIFAMLYIRPVKKAITKKIIIFSSLIAVAVFVPNLYMTIANNSDEDQFAKALGAFYPLADAIVLVPSLIGAGLFFGGKVNFLWSLMLVGMIIEVSADTGFQYFSLDNSIYTGHPVDILFLWTYIVLVFGVYDHTKIFKTEKKTLDDKENL